MFKKAFFGLILAAAGVYFVAGAADGQRQASPSRDEGQKLMRDGNWKEAWDVYSRLALDPNTDPLQVAGDLNNAVNCLNRVARINEFDEFIENVIETHSRNWRLLQAAAQQYLNVNKQGAMIGGEFVRGPHRGQAKFVQSYERDRTRAMQLQLQAMRLAAAEPNPRAAADFHWQMAGMLLHNRGFSQAWRLQTLTDFSSLPDYDEGHFQPWRYYGGSRGAPVNPDGTPVYYRIPESWEDAKSDGERWRWCLMQTVELFPGRRTQVRMHFAQFLHSQFGVQTMAQQAWLFRQMQDDDTRKDESGTYALHTLGEHETIARLATGIKRFALPDEFNFIRIFQEVADQDRGGQGRQAVEQLAQLFENRRQYPKAASWWRRAVDLATGRVRERYEQRLDQIVENWGRFEVAKTQPAGQGATVDFVFRNAAKLELEAYEIKVDKLLNDLKDYLKSNPRQLRDMQKMNIGNVGYSIVRENQDKYVGEKVASWNLRLEPRPNHFDRRITITTPLQKPGAYLVTGKLDDGNTSRIILWVADTAIVKKPVTQKLYCFVADAVTGKPVPKANVEFFGYRQERKRNLVGRGFHYEVYTENFAEFTDADGQVFVDPKNMNRYRWIIIARTDDGRFAYHGFTGGWVPTYHDREYNATKVFVITDRPVYRPEQKVNFKCWIEHAQYDREGTSAFAGQNFTVRINNPRGEKVFEKNYTADEYGGIAGELLLEKGATLGVYSLEVVGRGRGSFRVEEYKKPEFEVTIDSPAEPIMLGEKITAKIKANYYFGAPVTEATVTYKVLRHEHSAVWYPWGYWDWFYGPGYWWFAPDYEWYPGWRAWSCPRPLMPWWGWRPQPQPELVAEVVQPIGRDGTVDVEINTGLAKELFGDTDHRYEITAEVTDLSRRTIVGTGTVLVARKPFKVTAWVHRGHYRVGDAIQANFNARTLDGKPVPGKGELKLLKIRYKNNEPVESVAQQWNLDTNDEGMAELQMKASQPGQYRLSYKVTDAKDHTMEGGYVFVVRGEGYTGDAFRFNDIELVTDKREYRAGDKVQLMINTDRVNGTVLLFLRPANGAYLPPKVLRLDGKSALEEIAIVKRDMPNIFVEALTVSGGRVFTDVREIAVPPESRVLDVAVTPSKTEYKPGEKATVQVKLTEPNGEPYQGSVVLSMYDKAVEYISGGSNVPEIKEFFWKWRRHHNVSGETSLDRACGNLLKQGELTLQFIGVFGHSVADEEGMTREAENRSLGGGAMMHARGAAAPMAAMEKAEGMAFAADVVAETAPSVGGPAGANGGEAPVVQPTVRTQFADTALWVAALTTGKDGTAEVELTMPENLTTWKTRVWAMGDGTRCGEGTAEVVTKKNLIIRLQAPRFFVQKDEVVLSANIHNYLDTKKKVRAVLELDGPCLLYMDRRIAKHIYEIGFVPEPTSRPLPFIIEIEPNAEKRVDWRVKVVQPGEAVVRMKALTDEESDAMEMTFPVYVHGMLKTESFSGSIPPEGDSASIEVVIPEERRPEQSRLEIRYSPTLAMAMVDALPYLADYPYGCTEQTLNRFLPAAITQKILLDMGLNLKEIAEKRTNLNAQEIGDDVERAAQWKRFDRNPVFEEDLLRDMVKAGVERLTSMQVSDGGWGWFSGWGERSYPHTTALVVHGFQIARENDVAIVPGVLERGVEWLKNYQDEQVELLKNAEKDPKPKRWKSSADHLDAMIYMVLVDAGRDSKDMREYLYRDRNNLAVYAKAMFGIALHRVEDFEKRDMIVRNIEQFLVQDDENQTAYLKLNSGWWWHWYGSENEAHAYYLKLLAVTDPKGETARRLVKYLLNNRKHATYWNSTRDTAICIEAFADFIRAACEDRPDMTVEILIDGEKVKEVAINRDNLFTYDNKLVLAGDEVTTGKHRIEVRKKGTGPLYFNAYSTNFTLEDPITKAGLEIKVERRYYKLERVDKVVQVEGVRGQAVDQLVEKYERKPIANLDMLKSGDLLEVELLVESKNDYEYILFEDMKPAGCEPVEVRSGYTGNEMGAYVEFRDERVVFFVRSLGRDKHSVSYRMRAEIPGKFSALPTRGSAMYAPELKANSDEIKIQIED